MILSPGVDAVVPKGFGAVVPFFVCMGLTKDNHGSHDPNKLLASLTGELA